MPLTAETIEVAFVETAREQTNGQPFNWAKVAHKLNERLADEFLLATPPPGEAGPLFLLIGQDG